MFSYISSGNIENSQQLTTSYIPTDGKSQSSLMGEPRSFSQSNSEYSSKLFLKAVKRCFTLNSVFFSNENTKVAYVATKLFGPAEIWFNVLDDRDDPCLCDFNAFERKFIDEFSSKRSEWQLRVDLYYLKQNSCSISEYTSKFRELANQLRFSDEALLTFYFLGLNSDVQQYLESQVSMPKSFQEISDICVEYGSRINIRKNYPNINEDKREHSFQEAKTQKENLLTSELPLQPMEIYSISKRK